MSFLQAQEFVWSFSGRISRRPGRSSRTTPETNPAVCTKLDNNVEGIPVGRKIVTVDAGAVIIAGSPAGHRDELHIGGLSRKFRNAHRPPLLLKRPQEVRVKVREVVDALPREDFVLTRCD